MDVVSASDQIDRLIERRSGERSAADERDEMWRRSEARFRERIREDHRAQWRQYFARLADSLRASADEYDRKAEALLEEPEGREG